MRTDPERQARFVALVQEHEGRIRRIAALYARDRADREELFQEITLQLWRSFERFRGESAYSTFLYRVALNTALLRVRRRRSAPRVDAGAAVEELAAPVEPRGDEDVERLYAAIRELRPIDRAVVLLVLEERSHAEIAAVTGLSTGNVATRLFRCRQELRRRLGTGGTAKEPTSCSTET